MVKTVIIYLVGNKFNVNSDDLKCHYSYYMRYF